MQRYGEDQAGFSVAWEATTRLVNVVAWGFWSRETAASFTSAVLDVCKKAPIGTCLTLNMTDLKPMREEGQRAWTGLMSGLPAVSGIDRVSVVTGNALTKLQLLRLTKDSAIGDTPQFEWFERGPA
jgi:hypothetical protein